MYEDQFKCRILSECLTGGELFDYISSADTQDEVLAVRVMKQILSAVNYCHRKSVVIRYLKPEVLLLEKATTVEEEVSVKIVDFAGMTVLKPSRVLHKFIENGPYVAPEVLRGEYNEKCDVWALGVILHVMLSGKLPFTGYTSEEMSISIQHGQFSLEGEEWEGVSEGAKDLIKKMLTVSIKDRVSAQEALSHPWITQGTYIPDSVRSEHATRLLSLKKFQGEQKLKQALNSFVLERFGPKEDLKRQRELFQALDKDHSGILTKEELIEGLTEHMPREEAEEEVEKILNSLDTDGSHGVDYKEFLSATEVQAQSISKQNLKSAFDMIDTDHSGKISQSELKALCWEGH